ncbi:hypothetical protein GIW81_00755 [Hyphomicrobium sp. xq]|uniref:Uncharacterized protein n=1 Tax=Hyphomicrobium album TaxID=2665159 RepID=A0A6I3KGH9_9HYPH|nr:hypothetical protein [Hyphomicrobium album]MTD92857.1 hypothetical protein [Hyphomicrobium album]
MSCTKTTTAEKPTENVLKSGFRVLTGLDGTYTMIPYGGPDYGYTQQGWGFTNADDLLQFLKSEARSLQP